jgi:hypothetical protein
MAAENYGNPQLMDEIKQSFDIVLAHNPYYGDRILGFNNLYMFKTVEFYPQAPAFRILYKYDPEDDLNNVELLNIEPVNRSSRAVYW